MSRYSHYVTKAFEGLLAAMLAVMLGLVLLNVVLRYAGTGLPATEELSRTLFVWLTFTGAVLAAYEGAHLGVGSFVERLPPKGRLACTILSELGVLVCCVLIFYGTLRQHEVNASNRSLTTGMTMIWVYGVGYIASLGIGAVTVWRLWKCLAGLRRPAAIGTVLPREPAESVQGPLL
ncbi:TRAP transporter small permease [Variovorax sp. KK3]|uniref:TRAP transporter small permease n=1 Tax=Variovorax sp. KK3 TaxID=1855728 RepID=UPI00097C303B|nr:TRAP transporter small permease [Variovorax sp. KK3]